MRYGNLRRLVLVAAAACMLAPGFTEADSGGRRPLATLEPYFRESVLRGWRAFQTSHARDGVACVHCHPEHEAMRRWAPAYPKVEIFDATPFQVKGLRQVVREALASHTDLDQDEQLAMVEDLVAYIAWWGDGEPIMPGLSRPFPPPAEDLAMLAAAVARGRDLVEGETNGGCRRCHAEPVDVTTFPRQVNGAGRVLSFETFLASHLAALRTTTISVPAVDTAVTDIAAYLASLATGKSLRPGGPPLAAGEHYHDEKMH